MQTVALGFGWAAMASIPVWQMLKADGQAGLPRAANLASAAFLTVAIIVVTPAAFIHPTPAWIENTPTLFAIGALILLSLICWAVSALATRLRPWPWDLAVVVSALAFLGLPMLANRLLAGVPAP